jgi:SAM-dependent methyltransferase
LKENIYNKPEYYDIAFSWDNTKEIEMFKRFFQKHAEFAVRKVLEPACGTGRFLVTFPKHGYKITGYDSNPKMITYAKEKIKTAGYDNMADVFLMDMKSAKMDKKYDSAFNSINSLGYLLTDEDILSHLRNTGESIKRGGIYIIHLACAWDKLEPHKEEGWTMKRDEISIQTIWDIEKEDRQKKLSYQVCKMYITDHDEKREIIDNQILRLWMYDDIKNLIVRSQVFKLEAIYNEKEEEIPFDSHVNGEMGNLYYILKVLQ